MQPTIGRIVRFRSRTGSYTVPAIITATVDTLDPRGVELGHVSGLSSPTHVHLTVFTSGKPGMRRGADNFVGARAAEPVSENVAGCYQEWNVPLDVPEVEGEEYPGTWHWPTLKPARP